MSSVIADIGDIAEEVSPSQEDQRRAVMKKFNEFLLSIGESYSQILQLFF
jgi:hypothetical protein